jgi:hypothetical protein
VLSAELASNPPAPEGVPASVWKRIPLGKRRLLTYGPLVPGSDAFRTAAICIAAELRLHDVPEAVAVELVTGMPFTTGSSPRRKVLKQVPRFVRFAYQRKTPLLSGCPSIPSRNGDDDRRKLRDSFAAYCGNDCARTCSALRFNRIPEAMIAGTDYEPALLSSLWMPANSGGLGTDCQRLYAILASIAVAEGRAEIYAASTYLSNRIDGTHSARTLRDRMRKLRECGLVETLNKRAALYRVKALDADEIAELEERLGTKEAARWNVIENNHESLRKSSEFPSWDYADL